MPVKKEPTTEVPVVKPAVALPDSPAKAAFRKHIEFYAKQNPKKYALKEQALLKKLNSL